MKDTDYLSLSARIRSMENRLLDAERRGRMIDARTDDEALKILTECGYAEPENPSLPAVDAVLSQARQDLFADLSAAVPQPALVEVFQIKYDYHNAKALLKGRAMGEDAGHLLMSSGRYEPKALAEAFARGELEETSERFQAAVKRAGEILDEEQDPQKADTELDKACYGEMAAAAKESGSAFLQGYVRLSIDAANLRTVVRWQRLGADPALLSQSLIPGGDVPAEEVAQAKAGEGAARFKKGPLAKAAELGAALAAPGSGRLSEFERLCDDALTAYLSQAKRIPFGEQPVVGYLCAREAEATAIRTILSARASGVSGEVIRERLRDSYV